MNDPPLNLNLPTDIKAWIEEQRSQDLEDLLEEGLAGVPQVATPEYWRDVHRQIWERSRTDPDA